MAYEKQNFIDGLPLYAKQLNHIEDGIKSLEDQALTEEDKSEIINEVRSGLNQTDVVGALPLTGGTMSGAINMNNQKLNGLAEPTEDNEAATKKYVDEAEAAVIQQVKKAAPRNLLDNSDFTNPVNQRGQTSYSGQTYTIDRWYMQNGNKLDVNSGYITVTNTDSSSRHYLQQMFDGSILSGKTLTVAIKLHDGTIHCGSGTIPTVSGQYKDVSTFNGNTFRIYPDSVALMIATGVALDIDWVALYEGEYTLDTIPEYQPKGYGAELWECRRYFRTLNGYLQGTRGYSNAKHVQIPIDNSMRVIPTPVLVGTPDGACVGIDGAAVGYDGPVAVSKDYFVLTTKNDMAKQGPVAVYLNNIIQLDAEIK